jgi:hypothetical protein
MVSFSDRKDLPAPLLGCLYCHAEGTITEIEPRRLPGNSSDYPTLVCSQCHSAALFDERQAENTWRIRYRRVNRHEKYYFAALQFENTGWTYADDALETSTTIYIQRQRVHQALQGDLSWLRPVQLSPSPPPIMTSELVYLQFKHALLCTEDTPRRPGPSESPNDVLDSGAFYVTDQNVHLVGRDRDWSYALARIRDVEFSKKGWKVHLDTKETKRFFQAENHAEEMDAQLATAVIKTLWQRHQERHQA